MKKYSTTGISEFSRPRCAEGPGGMGWGPKGDFFPIYWSKKAANSECMEVYKQP